MLAVSTHASAAPRAPAVSTDPRLTALLRAGGELAASRLPNTGRLRWLPEALPSGRVRATVVESPWGSERAAVEQAAMVLRRAGYRVLACPALGRLTIGGRRRFQ